MRSGNWVQNVQDVETISGMADTYVLHTEMSLVLSPSGASFSGQISGGGWNVSIDSSTHELITCWPSTHFSLIF